MDDPDVTSTPTSTTKLLTTVAPEETTTKRTPPVGLCVLPSNPQEDTDANKDSGYRFGMLINF